MELKERQLKFFGYALPAILAFLALRHTQKHGLDFFGGILLGLAVVLLAIALFSRPLLVLVFGYWMKAAHVVGKVINTGVLVVLFFAVFTPLAVVLRFLKKDYLRLAADPRANTYWLPRQTQQDAGSDVQRQF